MRSCLWPPPVGSAATHHRSTNTLPSSATAPALARRHVASACDGWPQLLLDDALIITSELVTNAVRYGHAPIVLSIAVTSDRLHVEVRDENPAIPSSAAAPSDHHVGGRGLLIVGALATDWGSRPSPDRPGKTVWFDLHVSPQS